jgi:hypothetical protein
MRSEPTWGPCLLDVVGGIDSFRAFATNGKLRVTGVDRKFVALLVCCAAIPVAFGTAVFLALRPSTLMAVLTWVAIALALSMAWAELMGSFQRRLSLSPGRTYSRRDLRIIALLGILAPGVAVHALEEAVEANWLDSLMLMVVVLVVVDHIYRVLVRFRPRRISVRFRRRAKQRS